jgi:hypothetical protein
MKPPALPRLIVSISTLTTVLLLAAPPAHGGRWPLTLTGQATFTQDYYHIDPVTGYSESFYCSVTARGMTLTRQISSRWGATYKVTGLTRWKGVVTLIFVEPYQKDGASCIRQTVKAGQLKGGTRYTRKSALFAVLGKKALLSMLFRPTIMTNAVVTDTCAPAPPIYQEPWTFNISITDIPVKVSFDGATKILTLDETVEWPNIYGEPQTNEISATFRGASP